MSDDKPRGADDIAVVAKGGATQIVGQITHRSLTFFFTIALERVVGPIGYGLYRQISQILGVAGQIGLAGFNYSSMRFIARARAARRVEEVRGAARVGLAGTGVASAIVFVALLVAADYLAGNFCRGDCDADRFAFLLRIGALYVPAFAAMQVLRYCTQAYKTMVPSVVVGNIIQPTARFIAGVIALATGFAVAGAITTLVASMVIGTAAGVYFFIRILSPEERNATPSAPVGEMVRFALPQGGSSLLGVQSLGLGILVLGIYQSNFETGLFGVALALQGPGGVFLSGIVNIWAPVVSDLYERNALDRLGSLYQTVTRWIATFSFPIYAALILEPDLFLEFFSDKSADAAPVVAILAVGNIFYAGTGPTGYVISMTGRPGVNFANSIVAVAVYAVAGAAVVPEHGALGMAVVDALVTATVNLVRVLEAWILVGVQPFGRSFLKPVFATCVGAGVLLLWRLIPGDSIALEIAGVAVAALAYLVVLARLGIDPEERYVWDRIRRRAFRR